MKKNMAKVFWGLFLVMAVLILPIGRMDAHAASEATAAKKAYKQFMKGKPSYMKYKMVDITGDDVPELITRVPKSKAGTLNSNKFAFFSYVNGKVRYITTLYEKYKSLYYYPGSKVIVARCFRGDLPCQYEYYKVSKTKMKMLAYSYYLSGKRHYVFKDIYYLKKDFDKRLKKVTGTLTMKLIKF